MNRICLDTSAYSHFQRGRPEAVRHISRAREVLMPSIVLGELRTGFRLGNRHEDNEEELRLFLAEEVVRVLLVDEEASSHYADIVFDLRKAGMPLPTNDIWIAALASREGATILTYDEHFRKVARVGSQVLR